MFLEILLVRALNSNVVTKKLIFFITISIFLNYGKITKTKFQIGNLYSSNNRQRRNATFLLLFHTESAFNIVRHQIFFYIPPEQGGVDAFYLAIKEFVGMEWEKRSGVKKVAMFKIV